MDTNLLKNNKTFCIQPWIHTHVLPSGDVVPCCVWHGKDTFGNVKDGSLFEIWNNENYKDMRLSMLKGEKVKGCDQCYRNEQDTGESTRTLFNSAWEGHVAQAPIRTDDKGCIKDHRMPFMDIRFSNTCNMKCRGCYPLLSSAWSSDYAKLHDKPYNEDIKLSLFPNPSLQKEIEEIIPSIEKIYFAGGEPLLMEEHYWVLDQLIKHGKTDVEITYNTNLSILKFKNHNVIEYWNKFKDVNISLSIDDIGKRGNYFRKGTLVSDILSNVKYIKKNLPHVNFSINFTLSLFNAYFLDQVHDYLLEEKIINPIQFRVNFLNTPAEYCAQILPNNFKKLIVSRIETYMESLTTKYKEALFEDQKERMLKPLKEAINFISGENKSETTIKDFIQYNDRLDKIRGESFDQVYPELRFLRKVV
jgi:radical SAM protein with 4Fe4S-binding SPASM domain